MRKQKLIAQHSQEAGAAERTPDEECRKIV
jgi:hypothetical protein